MVSCKPKQEDNYRKIDASTIFTNTDSIPNKHYVGSKKCKECHPNQFKDWEGFAKIEEDVDPTHLLVSDYDIWLK